MQSQLASKEKTFHINFGTCFSERTLMNTCRQRVSFVGRLYSVANQIEVLCMQVGNTLALIKASRSGLHVAPIEGSCWRRFTTDDGIIMHVPTLLMYTAIHHPTSPRILSSFDQPTSGITRMLPWLQHSPTT